MNDERTKRRLDVHFAIRRVLLCDWDPIGVGNDPDVEDEYDDYIPDVLGHLEDGALAKTIAKYLWEVETKAMGLARGPFLLNRARLLRVADKLMQIDVSVPPCN